MEYRSSNWEESKVLYMDIGIVTLGKGLHQTVCHGPDDYVFWSASFWSPKMGRSYVWAGD